MDRDRLLPPGHLLGQYRIESTLGAGGFGVTYRAIDTTSGASVAIKEYLPKAPGDFDKGKRRFLKEAATLASFSHPNIVRVLSNFETSETAYMALELVEGAPLATWARERWPLDQRAVLALLHPILDGLEVVHAANYLHRDLKPVNVLVRESGVPVLIDFGSARLALDEVSELSALVTPGFTPLEQYHTNGYQGPWTDLYAVGGILYWLVTGTAPVDAPARVLGTTMAPAFTTANTERFTPAFLETIDWMLHPLRNKRPQSVSEVRARL